MEKYRHGGEIYNKTVTLDYSVNINPLGLPSRVKEVLIKNIDQFIQYPDNNCNTLIKAIADYEQVDKNHIICGNGASDIIFRLCFARKPKRAMVLAPTFSEYEKALLASGSAIEYYLLKEDDCYAITEKIVDSLNENVDMLFLCNPNNPVGNCMDIGIIEKIIQQCKIHNIFLVVDECFLDFVEKGDLLSVKKYIHNNSNIFIIKAFTKIYAMAGLRLGYGLCCNFNLLEKMQDIGPSWNVSIPAQIAGVEALLQQEYLKDTMELIKIERNYLCKHLKRLGLKVFDPTANYIFFQSKKELYEPLLKKGILIRWCDNYRQLGKEYYRIAIKNHGENVEFINQIEQVLLENNT
ncbi:MAG: threonine-phosphate decarboxylase [Anaerocolumna sp.]|jgi:threonine-phosphate decarboxylase|nr:threonine-phosphate decarboxylase [Anaerocolumna sp.]